MRASRTRATAFALGALACGAVGCLSPRSVPDMVHYTLAPPGTPRESLPGPPRVERFGIDAPYATVRLAHRSSPYRLEYYTFHRWAGTPQEDVTTAVRDYLSRAPVVPDGLPLVVSGDVRRLEEQVDPGGRRSGVVAIDFTVHRDGEPILARGYEESEPAEGTTPEASVAALSRALARMLDRLIDDVRQAEAAGPSPPQRTRSQGDRVGDAQPIARVR